MVFSNENHLFAGAACYVLHSSLQQSILESFLRIHQSQGFLTRWVGPGALFQGVSGRSGRASRCLFGQPGRQFAVRSDLECDRPDRYKRSLDTQTGIQQLGLRWHG